MISLWRHFQQLTRFFFSPSNSRLKYLTKWIQFSASLIPRKSSVFGLNIESAGLKYLLKIEVIFLWLLKLTRDHDVSVLRERIQWFCDLLPFCFRLSALELQTQNVFYTQLIPAGSRVEGREDCKPPHYIWRFSTHKISSLLSFQIQFCTK